jgi:hypothetical protein
MIMPLTPFLSMGIRRNSLAYKGMVIENDRFPLALALAACGIIVFAVAA